MKLSGFLSAAIIIIAFVSCQKSYNPPDLVIPPGGGTTPPATGGGSQLSKLVITEGSSSEKYTYQYDGNGRLSDVAMDGVAAGQSIKYSWHFVRDNSGKLLEYVLKNNIPGFPAAGVTYTFHYPSSSIVYLTGSFVFQGLSEKDSIVFTYTNGKVAKYDTYGDYGNSGYEAFLSTTYLYDGNGNVIDEKQYGIGSSGSLVLGETTTYEYDDKNNALQLGFEGYLLGAARYFSKNNYIKSINTVYNTSPAGDKSTTNISYQYNSANKPVSGVATDPAVSGSSAQLTFTY